MFKPTKQHSSKRRGERLKIYGYYVDVYGFLVKVTYKYCIKNIVKTNCLIIF